jgi:hypothetical protein
VQQAHRRRIGDSCQPGLVTAIHRQYEVDKHMMEIPMKTLSMALAAALLTACSGMHSMSGGADSGYGSHSGQVMDPTMDLYRSGS